MSGDVGAALDVVTGGLAARAVEPRAGEAGHGGGGGLCLNCGTRLIGPHCHACGQAADVHRTVGAIGHEIAHGVFHFEGKIWRTLPLLVLHPGTLTRRYVAGERARFVSPLALFLFTVFLLFATISAVGGEWDGDIVGSQKARALPALDAGIATAERKLADAVPRGHAAALPPDRVRALRTELASLRQARDAVAHGDANDATLTNIRTGWPRLDHGIAKADANPGLALYKLQSSAYKYSWALIPLSTPFVAMLFLWRRRYNLYDHAIFVTYSIAFMMLLVIALTIAGALGVGSSLISLAALLIPPVHMFAQLRGAYALRRRSALWRTAALLVFAFVVLAAFAMLLLAHGLAE